MKKKSSLSEWAKSHDVSRRGGPAKCWICARPEVGKDVAEAKKMGWVGSAIHEYVKEVHGYPYNAGALNNHLRVHGAK